MASHLQKGDHFKLNKEALDNDVYQRLGYTASTVLTVSEWYDHYAPSGRVDQHGHPGFDGEEYLYEVDNEPVAFYEWEIEEVKE